MWAPNTTSLNLRHNKLYTLLHFSFVRVPSFFHICHRHTMCTEKNLNLCSHKFQQNCNEGFTLAYFGHPTLAVGCSTTSVQHTGQTSYSAHNICCRHLLIDDLKSVSQVLSSTRSLQWVRTSSGFSNFISSFSISVAIDCT